MEINLTGRALGKKWVECLKSKQRAELPIILEEMVQCLSNQALNSDDIDDILIDVGRRAEQWVAYSDESRLSKAILAQITRIDQIFQRLQAKGQLDPSDYSQLVDEFHRDVAKYGHEWQEWVDCLQGEKIAAEKLEEATVIYWTGSDRLAVIDEMEAVGRRSKDGETCKQDLLMLASLLRPLAHHLDDDKLKNVGTELIRQLMGATSVTDKLKVLSEAVSVVPGHELLFAAAHAANHRWPKLGTVILKKLVTPLLEKWYPPTNTLISQYVPTQFMREAEDKYGGDQTLFGLWAHCVTERLSTVLKHEDASVAEESLSDPNSPLRIAGDSRGLWARLIETTDAKSFGLVEHKMGHHTQMTGPYERFAKQIGSRLEAIESRVTEDTTFIEGQHWTQRVSGSVRIDTPSSTDKGCPTFITYSQEDGMAIWWHVHGMRSLPSANIRLKAVRTAKEPEKEIGNCYFDLSNALPFSRGSAAAAHWILVALLRNANLKVPPARAYLDCEALSHGHEQFVDSHFLPWIHCETVD